MRGFKIFKAVALNYPLPIAVQVAVGIANLFLSTCF